MKLKQELEDSKGILLVTTKIINKEQEIIISEINNLLEEDKGWKTADNYLTTPPTFSKDYDINFRKKVKNNLLEKGLNETAIEMGLESTFTLWGKTVIERAFNNLAYPNFDTIEYPKYNEDFKENWIKLRLYEYYKRNKKSVDKYGELLPEMNLNKKEVKQLRILVDDQTVERKVVIENIPKVYSILI